MMDSLKIASVIESLLFISDKPVTIERLAEVLGEETATPQEIQEHIETIRTKFSGEEFGFELREAQGGFHFSTKATNSEWVRKFLQTKPFRLGRSALEVLAIIAYRQPLTRAEIDKVRGIDSSHLMRTLIERGLVRMAGKAEVPGRPVQYGTTPRFLEITGLKSIAELPPLSELEQLQGHTETHEQNMEEGLDHFIADQTALSEQLGEETAGLEVIDTMIQSARKADNEIYESEVHADVAHENEAALAGFLETFKPFRKSRRSTAVAEADAEAPPEDGAPEEFPEETTAEANTEDLEPPTSTELPN